MFKHRERYDTRTAIKERLTQKQGNDKLKQDLFQTGFNSVLMD